MRVIKDRESRCAIIISEAPDAVAMVRLEVGTGITVLQIHPMVWGENAATGEMHYSGVSPNHIKWSFDEMWRPVIGSDGHPYTVQEAARKFLRGVNQPTMPEFGSGAVEALTRCLPEGDVHLFTAESGFVGRFSAVEDAVLIARAHKQKPIFFENAKDIKELSDQDLAVVKAALDSERKWPQKINYQEIYNMSKAKTAAAPKKVTKVEASKKRADGPVAKARAIFEKMRDKTSAEITAACIAAGINKGTTNVQLGKWRKENGIVVQRGGGKKVAPKAKAKPAAKAPVKAKKEKPAAAVVNTPPADTSAAEQPAA